MQLNPRLVARFDAFFFLGDIFTQDEFFKAQAPKGIAFLLRTE